MILDIVNPIPCACLNNNFSYFRDGRCLACLGTGIADRAREKVLKDNLIARRPTMDGYLGFDGAHCHKIHRTLPENWQCPGCLRNKFQILRWTTLNPKSPMARKKGWALGYHTHHDHAADKFGLSAPPVWFSPRFEPIVICEPCNTADGAAKRKLKLPKDFSFSPAEIRRFVTAFPHGKHLIDYRVAREIYWKLYPCPLT